MLATLQDGQPLAQATAYADSSHYARTMAPLGGAPPQSRPRSRSPWPTGAASIALSGPLGIQPVFLDTMLHVAGIMANLRGDVSDVYICSSVGSLKVLRDLVDDKRPCTVHYTIN